MSDVKARYVGGSMTGVDLSIPFKDGDVVQVHVKHQGELPSELPDGRKVPASFRDSLLEQEDNWTTVRRDTTKAAAKEGDK